MTEQDNQIILFKGNDSENLPRILLTYNERKEQMYVKITNEAGNYVISSAAPEPIPAKVFESIKARIAAIETAEALRDKLRSARDKRKAVEGTSDDPLVKVRAALAKLKKIKL